ncbi:MAG: DegT/DnrJ/EryC1/StrS family aminotransferase [Desulfovermiculus sp.]
MDILIDVNIVLDICTQRKPYAQRSALALELARYSGGKLWLYCGSTLALEYTLYNELQRDNADSQTPLSNKALLQKARILLDAFAKDKHWLAALAGEGAVFASPDPEDEQLIRALERFAPGSIKLLTRDAVLLRNHADKTITPDGFIDETLNAAPRKTIDFVDLKTQQQAVRSALEQNIHQVLHHGKYIMGPEVARLEKKLAEYVGVKHCIGVASGSDALLMALMAIGVGPGDEVITSPFTFIATGEMISLLGATPVFVDIDPQTYNIDPTKIESAITPRTKAILPVSLYGQPADFEAINAIAEKYNNVRRSGGSYTESVFPGTFGEQNALTGYQTITVIEDAAQSFGATYKARKSCALSDIACTSFFPSKPLGGYGDGGALFTDQEEIAKTLCQIRDHGQDRRYHHPIIGINGRLDTLQAAIVLAKFDIFPQEVELRQQAGQRYTALLQDVPGVTPPLIKPDRTSVYAQYTVQVPDRDQVQAALKDQGIPTAVHYPVPLYRQPAFAGLGLDPAVYPVAEKVSRRVVSLPMHPYLTREEQEKVCAVLREAAGESA